MFATKLRPASPDAPAQAATVDELPRQRSVALEPLRWVVSDNASAQAACRAISLRAGLTQPQVAERVGISHPTLVKYLLANDANQHRRMGVAMLARIAAVCGCRIVIEALPWD